LRRDHEDEGAQGVKPWLGYSSTGDDLPLRGLSPFTMHTLRRCLLTWLLAAVMALPGVASARTSLDPRLAAIVVDADTGRVLYSQRADARRYPASLAKVMTLYLTFEALESGRLTLSDRLRISPHAAAQPPSKIGLRAGSTLTIGEAIDLIVVKSANDVAAALGEKLAGAEAKFARRMTAKAARLGMGDTRFTNASGLPDSAQRTTARDMAILARAILRDFPDYAGVFNQSRARFRGKIVQGHNRLLSMPGVKGMKTGYTRAAGFNLMTSAERGDHRLVAVVLGGATSASRDAYMRRLVDAGFKVADAEGGDLTMAQLLHGAAPDHRAIAQELAQGSDETPTASEAIWSVQVGAFSGPRRAAAAGAALRAHNGKLLSGHPLQVRRSGKLHIARFKGFSKQAAADACKRLEAAGKDCLAIRTGPG
jgi:D-alanyl-D-alanine carboxypeptidase